MARKKYSDDQVNDLADSVFFRKPEISPTPAAETVPSTQLPHSEGASSTPPRQEQTTSDRPSARTYVRSANKRIKTRYAFEFFQDQLEQLKQYSLDQQLQGESGNMSAMVREAIDAYISRRNNRE